MESSPHCQLCGGFSFDKVRKPVPMVPKSSLCTTIQRAFNIDVSKDAKEHPEFVCELCHTKISRWELLENQRKEEKLNISLATFSAEEDFRIDYETAAKFGFALSQQKQVSYLLKVDEQGRTVYRVRINLQGQWKLLVNDKEVHQLNSYIKDLPDLVTKENVNNFLHCLSQLTVCPGNIGFNEACRHRSKESLAVFLSVNGQMAAQEEVYNGPIRHVSCDLITNGNRCGVCTHYRSTLCALRKRVILTQNNENPSAKQSHSSMTRDQMHAKLTSVVKTNKSQKRKLEHLQEQFNKLARERVAVLTAGGENGSSQEVFQHSAEDVSSISSENSISVSDTVIEID